MDRINDSVLKLENGGQKNPYSGIFYAVSCKEANIKSYLNFKILPIKIALVH